jgi:hypothetical protein
MGVLPMAAPTQQFGAFDTITLPERVTLPPGQASFTAGELEGIRSERASAQEQNARDIGNAFAGGLRLWEETSSVALHPPAAHPRAEELPTTTPPDTDYEYNTLVATLFGGMDRLRAGAAGPFAEEGDTFGAAAPPEDEEGYEPVPMIGIDGGDVLPARRDLPGPPLPPPRASSL